MAMVISDFTILAYIVGTKCTHKSWPTQTFIPLIYNHIPQNCPQRECYGI